MINKLKVYGFFGGLRMLISLFYTKLFFSKARIIRIPFDIRNKNKVEIGYNFTTGFNCRIEAITNDNSSKKLIKIGDNVQINDNVHIAAIGSVTIGDNVLLASKIFISDHNHGNYSGLDQSNPNINPIDRKLSYKPVQIKKNVWIGESVSILQGVSIGQGSIIGANSVVSKSIPDYTIAVGSPAVPIKKYNFKKNKWEKFN
jgi:lipopolysaccharide O-acetyltransferase